MRLQTRPALGEKIGEGGEGTVFALSSNAEEVAKIYREPLKDEAAAKLEAMVNAGPGTLEVHAAWPRALLRGKDGRIEGFIMARAAEPFDIHEIYSPRDRARHLPHSDWGFLVRVAANTAVAFAAAHAAGIVIGDVNHGSVRVGKNGKVRLIDCDSMQFAVEGQVYRCRVGMDTYTPPELQSLRLADVDRTADHDAFGLAVLIFQLLFLGRHPFSGVPVKPGAPTDIAGAIAANAYAYLDPPKVLRPPPAAPLLSLVNEEIRALFLRAFQPSTTAGCKQRPTAREWALALTALAGGLKTCSRNRMHVHRGGLSSCPWCAFEQVGVSVFVDTGSGPLSDGRFDPHALIRISQRLSQEIARTKRLGTWTDKNVKLPPERGRQLKGLATLRWQLGWPGVILSLFGGILFTGWAFFGIPAVGLAFLIANDRLFNRRRRRVSSQAVEQRTLLGQLTGPAYHEALAFAAQVERARNGAAQLLQQVQESSPLGTRTLRELQLNAYLDTFRIGPGCVNGVGPGRIAQLASFGIETAADVDLMQISMVPGFGAQLTDRLVEWRRDLEQRFRFNPKSSVADERRGRGKAGLSPAEVKYFMAVSSLDGMLRRLAVLNDILEKQRASIEPKLMTLAEELQLLKHELQCLE